MARRERMALGILAMIGIPKKVGTHVVRVLAEDHLGKVLICAGTDIPHAADVGDGLSPERWPAPDLPPGGGART